MRPEHAALNGVTLPPSDDFWESYYPPNGWRCRCTVVQVRKKKHPATPHDEAMALGEAALERDTKGMFRFNPGKQERVFPAYNAYTQEKCVRCKLGGKATLGKVEMVKIPDYQNCQACKYLNGCLEAPTIIARHEAADQIKKEKQKIPIFGGLPIVSDKFITGKLILLRRSLQDVYEHGVEDGTLMKWLSKFTPQSIHDWTYEGWGENRPYDINHPLYDPKNSDKKKHPETYYFLYYSLTIDGKKYWANVKMHKNDKGEVLYTIESAEPEDLIEGLPYKK